MRISDWSSDVCSSDLPHPSSSPNREVLFCTAALRLAGMAAVPFGWRTYEFWEATPAALAVILAEMTPGRGEGPTFGDELARVMEMFPAGRGKRAGRRLCESRHRRVGQRGGGDVGRTGT